MAPYRILVVDDDPDTADAFAAVLEGAGFDVAVAPSGEAALAHVRDGRLPDAIVLDGMMPVMDGFEFRRRQLADERLAAMPVVFVSGDPSSFERARDLGLRHRLAKPVDPALLVGMVRAALASSGPAR